MGAREVESGAALPELVLFPDLPPAERAPLAVPEGVGPTIVVQANALQLPLPDDSVDLIVTSPPYFSMRKYQDNDESYDGQIGTEATPQEFLEALWAATAECRRVLKPGGSLFLNIMDKFNSAASNQNGLGATLQGGSHESNRIGRGTTIDLVPRKSLIGVPWRYALGVLDGRAGGEWLLRGDLIWHKTNGMPDPTRDRAQRKHEYIFHFTKREHYFSNPEAVAPMKTVWDMPTDPSQFPPGIAKHPAPFPPELPRQLVLGFSPENGVVLDLFGGSGTTAMVASALGRTGISVDLSADYCRGAAWRVRDPGQLARVRRRTGL